MDAYAAPDMIFYVKTKFQVELKHLPVMFHERN